MSAEKKKNSKSKDVNINFRLLIIFLSITASFIFLLRDVLNRPEKTEKITSSYAYNDMQRSILDGVKSTLIPEGAREITESREVVTHGPRNLKRIALTFDADMTPFMRQNLNLGYVKSYYDKNLIDILNKTGTKATFFLTGMWIEAYPEVTESFAKNYLFELGNHSYSHPSFTDDCFGLAPIPDDRDATEIDKTQDLLEKYTGKRSRFFRFPGGCYTQSDLDIVLKKDLMVVHWDTAAQDGFSSDLEAIENNVEGHVQNGSIIVMHMNGYPNEPKTAQAVADLIPKLKKEGFEFVKVSELLGINTVTRILSYLKYLN